MQACLSFLMVLTKFGTILVRDLLLFLEIMGGNNDLSSLFFIFLNHHLQEIQLIAPVCFISSQGFMKLRSKCGQSTSAETFQFQHKKKFKKNNSTFTRSS